MTLDAAPICIPNSLTNTKNRKRAKLNKVSLGRISIHPFTWSSISNSGSPCSASVGLKSESELESYSKSLGSGSELSLFQGGVHSDSDSRKIGFFRLPSLDSDAIEYCNLVLRAFSK